MITYKIFLWKGTVFQKVGANENIFFANNTVKEGMVAMKELFDYKNCMAEKYLSAFSFPWQALCGLSDYIRETGKKLKGEEYCEIKNGVWAHKSAYISESTEIEPPCIIAESAVLRHCAYIRGSVIIGRGCIIGNSCEIKNSLLFDFCQISHFNYIGDSVIGYKAHFGAGSITSNLKCDNTEVSVIIGKKRIESGMRKLGAMVGDHVQIGCNATLNPGAIIGRGSIIYPNTSIRGYVPPNIICKSSGLWVKKEEGKWLSFSEQTE